MSAKAMALMRKALRTPANSANQPARMAPKRLPPWKTITHKPMMRPRLSSGVACCTETSAFWAMVTCEAPSRNAMTKAKARTSTSAMAASRTAIAPAPKISHGRRSPFTKAVTSNAAVNAPAPVAPTKAPKPSAPRPRSSVANSGDSVTNDEIPKAARAAMSRNDQRTVGSPSANSRPSRRSAAMLLVVAPR